MALLDSIRIFVLTILMADALSDLDNPLVYKVFNAICDKVGGEPDFKREIVADKIWTIHFTWNIDWSDFCVNVSFKVAHPLMVNNVRNSMELFLETQPNWDDAKLMVIISPTRHVLLIADPNGKPGHFIQVPQMSRDPFRMKPMIKQVALFRMVLKLYYVDQYLVLSDCRDGVTFILYLRDRKPNREEMSDVASSLGLGEGIPACTKI